MTCRQIKSQLPDYLGRQLDLPVMADVRDHLAGCPHCSAELASLQKLLALAALDETPAMPISQDEFLRAIRRKLQATSYRPQAIRTLRAASGSGSGLGCGRSVSQKQGISSQKSERRDRLRVSARRTREPGPA